MKWVWLVLLGVLVPLLMLAAVGVTLYRPGLPIAAQTVLNDYLAENGSGAQPLHVQAAERAPHRQEFMGAMIGRSFGGDYYFNEAGRPAPFPTTELWCITLAGAGEPRTVFVAQHEDMYVGTWLVHEPASAQAVTAVCN